MDPLERYRLLRTGPLHHRTTKYKYWIKCGQCGRWFKWEKHKNSELTWDIPVYCWRVPCAEKYKIEQNIKKVAAKEKRKHIKADESRTICGKNIFDEDGRRSVKLSKVLDHVTCKSCLKFYSKRIATNIKKRMK